MPTIIVLADTDTDAGAPQAHLHQHVSAEHLIDTRATSELLRRVVVALVEAEQAEREHRAQSAGHGCSCGVEHAMRAGA